MIYKAFILILQNHIDAFSPIMMHAALVLPDTAVGIIEASAILMLVNPRILSLSSTTDNLSVPILQVLVGCRLDARDLSRRLKAHHLLFSFPGVNSHPYKSDIALFPLIGDIISLIKLLCYDLLRSLTSYER